MADPTDMDGPRSTRWRSAVIGGCMILVPLCAIFGTTFSKLIYPAPAKKLSSPASKSSSTAKQKQDTTLLGAALTGTAPNTMASPDAAAPGVARDSITKSLPTLPSSAAATTMVSAAPARGSLVPSIPARNPPALATSVEPLPPLPRIRPDPHVRLASETAHTAAEQIGRASCRERV